MFRCFMNKMWVYGVTCTLLILFTAVRSVSWSLQNGFGLEAFLSRVTSLTSLSPLIIVMLEMLSSDDLCVRSSTDRKRSRCEGGGGGGGATKWPLLYRWRICGRRRWLNAEGSKNNKEPPPILSTLSVVRPEENEE